MIESLGLIIVQILKLEFSELYNNGHFTFKVFLVSTLTVLFVWLNHIIPAET